MTQSQIMTVIGRQMRVKGMSQRQAARALGTTQSAVSLYLSGSVRPGVHIVDAWLRLLELNVTPADPPATPERNIR